MGTLDSILESTIKTYQELNASSVPVLTEAPSPLEFMAFVARNKPFLLKRGTRHWPAARLWNSSYLMDTMGDTRVKIAVTPLGNADSVLHDGRSLYFVKPLEREEPFADFLTSTMSQESATKDGESVLYSQGQNDNLRDEYMPLYKDVDADIPWARIALGCKPDAINLWLGNSKSVTSLHRDNYENLYGQISGSKHFVLLPPIETPCVNEQSLPAATYTVDSNGQWRIERDIPEYSVPSAIWDPDKPQDSQNQFSHLSRPYRVTVEPGDLLYLPALWYHKVSQTCSDSKFCCSVNYWYDMNYEGPLWTSGALLRDLALSASLDPSKREHGIS